MSRKIEQQMSAECLAGRVRILSRVVTGIYDDELRPYGLRSSQINILVVVAARGPIAPSAVCSVLRLEKSTLSRDVERLVANGWIRVTPAPGRGQRLEILPPGRELIQSVEPAWKRAQAQTVKILGGALVTELHRVIDQGALDPPAET